MLIFDHQALVNLSKKSPIGFLRRLRILPPVLGILQFAGITSGAVEEAACGVATENKRDHCKDRQTVTWWDERVPGRNTLFVYFPSPVHGQSPAFENWRIFINLQSLWKRPMNYEPISVTSNFFFTVFLVLCMFHYFLNICFLFFAAMIVFWYKMHRFWLFSDTLKFQCTYFLTTIYSVPQFFGIFWTHGKLSALCWLCAIAYSKKWVKILSFLF